MVHLLIEGWRGISHSYALLSQRQALEMAQMEQVSLRFRDLPFAFAHWKATEGASGFSPHQDQILEAIRAPDPSDPIDAIYRVCSPLRMGTEDNHADRITLSFMITELGLCAADFLSGNESPEIFLQGRNRIVTSSCWSRDRIVDYGFADNRIDIVPLGVDHSIFKPSEPERRAELRNALGWSEDDIVFLNIGAPIWTKGTDLLLRAFCILKRQGRTVRLVIKDQRGIYGLSLDQMIKQLAGSCPELNRSDVLSGITTVPQSLSLQQLAGLMNAADCYVSPYRAEGFNLPVLEAMACGLPVITTAGGATDEFCCEALSLRIPGRFHRQDLTGRTGQAFIEPDLEALVGTMASIGRRACPDTPEQVGRRRELCDRFSWRSSAQRMVDLARFHAEP